jgi:type VI secretion system protein ImpB
MPESTQHKLDRIRPPRVHITYDVEIGGAIQKKELPFVLGVMSDLSGQRDAELPKIKERKFVEIDRDNFNDVMASIAPRVVVRVANKLANDGTELSAELRFKHMDEFEPVALLNQVPALKRLYEARGKLNDLLAKLDGNDKLESMLQDVVANNAALKELKTQTGGTNA